MLDSNEHTSTTKGLYLHHRKNTKTRERLKKQINPTQSRDVSNRSRGLMHWSHAGGRGWWHRVTAMISHSPSGDRLTLTYLGDEWRCGGAVNVAWMELEDAGEELAEAADRQGRDSGLQSQELWAQAGSGPPQRAGVGPVSEQRRRNGGYTH